MYHHFPIRIWLTHEYPLIPPVCYSKETARMKVEINENVEDDGKLASHICEIGPR